MNWENFRKNCDHRLLDASDEFYECTINEDEKGNCRICSQERDCPLLNKTK